MNEIKITESHERMKLTDEPIDFYESGLEDCKKKILHEMWFKAITALDIEGLLNRKRMVKWLNERAQK